MIITSCMMFATVIEIFARQVFGYSFGISDELGGYLLVALTFLSLPVCQANNVFHTAELVQGRLSRAARRLSQILFSLFSLGVAGALLWQTGRFCWLTWVSGEKSTTDWMVPLWIPRLSMPIGCLVLCVVLIKTLNWHFRSGRLRVPGDERITPKSDS